MEINLAQLCNSDKDTRIRFSVWTKNGKCINEVHTTVNAISDFTQTYSADAKSSLTLSDWKVYEKLDFVNYLRAGWGVSIFGAIDYTASNGDPTDRDSLHYLMTTRNPYMESIFNVGNIIDKYDSDNKFPFYGFGAKPLHMGTRKISHCFPINGNDFDPEIHTISNVVKTYRNTL